jgi:hypothetical protein
VYVHVLVCIQQDLDGSGSIDTHELALVLRKLGEVASDARSAYHYILCLYTL